MMQVNAGRRDAAGVRVEVRFGRNPHGSYQGNALSATASRVTTRDMATRAGVSVATVSGTLAGGLSGAAVTRHKVLRAMSDLDYVPNTRGGGQYRPRRPSRSPSWSTRWPLRSTPSSPKEWSSRPRTRGDCQCTGSDMYCSSAARSSTAAQYKCVYPSAGAPKSRPTVENATDSMVAVHRIAASTSALFSSAPSALKARRNRLTIGHVGRLGSWTARDWSWPGLVDT